MEVFSEGCFTFCLVIFHDCHTIWYTVPDSGSVQGQSFHKDIRQQTVSRNGLYIKILNSRQYPGNILM